MTRVLPLALLLVALGCGSAEPQPQPAAPAPAPTPTPAPPPEQEPPSPPQEPEEGLYYDDQALPYEHVDETQGAVATLVYVTEQRVRGAVQPGAIILSSDEQNPHFRRQTTSRVGVHKLTRADMAALLAELGGQGFDRLPWTEQPYDAEIGPQRGFYLYRDGQRRFVLKDGLPELDRIVFTDLERRIIERTTRGG